MIRKITAKAIFLFIYFASAMTSYAQSLQTENIVAREVNMWKFNTKEDVTTAYFPCTLATEYCKKLNIRDDGFYKAYFYDGFVLTLSLSGKILEHYYNPSPKNMNMLIKNWDVYRNSDFKDLGQEIKKNLLMRRKDLKDFIEKLFGIEELYLGNYDSAIEKSSNFIAQYGEKSSKELLSSAFAVRALAKKEIGKKEEFFSDAEIAYSLDSNSDWTRRAMAFLYIEKGNFNEVLKVLPEKRDAMIDLVIEMISYTKNGDIKKALDMYNLLEDSFETRSEFLKQYISIAKVSLKPYADAKLNSAKDYEEKGQYREAIKEYAEYLKFANKEEAKDIRNHIATLMAKYPHLFTLTEDARKFVVRAEVYVSEGEFEKAISEYKKAIKIQPFFPALYKAIALNYAELKNYKQAIENMQIYLQLYPDAPDIRAVKDQIYRWELLIENVK